MIVFLFVLIVAASIVIGRMAEADRGEGLKWGAITFVLCILSLAIKLPFLNVMLACGISFALMTVTKKTFY